MKKMILLTIAFTVLGFMTSAIERPTEEQVVTVKAGYGDTVWAVCERTYHEKEVRSFDEFVFDTRKENDLLGGKMLQAGQTIVVRKKVRR